jgi:hypothetical protein
MKIVNRDVKCNIEICKLRRSAKGMKIEYQIHEKVLNHQVLPACEHGIKLPTNYVQQEGFTTSEGLRLGTSSNLIIIKSTTRFISS